MEKSMKKKKNLKKNHEIQKLFLIYQDFFQAIFNTVINAP